MQVQPTCQVSRRLAHGDLWLVDLAGELVELQGRHLLEEVGGDLRPGQPHLRRAGGAVEMHLDGGVLVVVRQPLVGHDPTVLATSGYSYLYPTVGSGRLIPPAPVPLEDPCLCSSQVPSPPTT